VRCVSVGVRRNFDALTVSFAGPRPTLDGEQYLIWLSAYVNVVLTRRVMTKAECRHP